MWPSISKTGAAAGGGFRASDGGNGGDHVPANETTWFSFSSPFQPSWATATSLRLPGPTGVARCRTIRSTGQTRLPSVGKSARGCRMMRMTYVPSG